MPQQNRRGRIKRIEFNSGTAKIWTDVPLLQKKCIPHKRLDPATLTAIDRLNLQKANPCEYFLFSLLSLW